MISGAYKLLFVQSPNTKVVRTVQSNDFRLNRGTVLDFPHLRLSPLVSVSRTGKDYPRYSLQATGSSRRSLSSLPPVVKRDHLQGNFCSKPHRVLAHMGFSRWVSSVSVPTSTRRGFVQSHHHVRRRSFNKLFPPKLLDRTAAVCVVKRPDGRRHTTASWRLTTSSN